MLIRRFHQCVARQRSVEHFACGLSAGYGKAIGIEKTQLNEHTGLIPVDVLMHEFVALKLHYGDRRNLNSAPGRFDAGQHPVHLAGVSEANDEFVDDGTLPDGAADGEETPW